MDLHVAKPAKRLKAASLFSQSRTSWCFLLFERFLGWGFPPPMADATPHGLELATSWGILLLPLPTFLSSLLKAICCMGVQCHPFGVTGVPSKYCDYPPL